jgi:hypothetical protein
MQQAFLCTVPAAVSGELRCFRQSGVGSVAAGCLMVALTVFKLQSAAGRKYYIGLRLRNAHDP